MYYIARDIEVDKDIDLATVVLTVNAIFVKSWLEATDIFNGGVAVRSPKGLFNGNLLALK